MTGKEPAAFNFVDLTQCGDDTDVNYASTSAAPLETKPLLTPLSPMVQPNDSTCSRAPLVYMMQQAPGHPCLLRAQGYALPHSEYSSSMMNINTRNNGQVGFRQGISDDHCRAYLEQQGGISEARQCRQLEPQPIPPTAPVEIENESILSMQPEQTYTQGNRLTQAQVTPEQTQMLQGNHLTPAATHHHSAADFDRMKQAQMEESRRQKDLMMYNEASQQQAILFQQQHKHLMVLSEANRQRAIMFQKAAIFQQQKAAMFQLAMRAAPSLNRGQNVQVNPQSSQDQAPPPPRQLFSCPPPRMNFPIANININNNMKHGSPNTVPGSLNWDSQQEQQHVPAGHPPNLMSGEGSRLAMQHCGVTGQLALIHASRVNIFQNVSFEQAQVVCKMLAGKESEYWPPGKFHHHASGPQPDARLMSQPRLIAPHMSAPFAPRSAQAGPSQAPPTGPEPSQETKAPLTRFLEKKKGWISSTDIKEEDNIVIDQPGLSSARTWHHNHIPTHVATPATLPGTSSLKRKIAHDHDANMHTGDLYMRAGGSGEYVTVKEDVKPASILSVTDYIRTRTDHVMREYEALLKDSTQ